MRVITLDLETQNIFQDIGSNDPKSLDISVVGIHDSNTGECMAFTENELKNLWPILENADAIVTWNGDHFDIPLLDKYYPGDLTKIKSIDLMKAVYDALGRRLKLDTVAQATLGVQKSGNGLDAVTWWKNGEIDKIIKYCLDDVRITREVFDYALKNKSIKYRDGTQIKELRLNTDSWLTTPASSLTFTLPF
jgi:DEAD/DEAH box helicase domain-containing protein